MIVSDHADFAEALAIQEAQHELNKRKGENSSKLLTRLERLKKKKTMRIVVGNSIVTVSVQDGGDKIQVHTSDLDGVHKGPPGYDVK